MADKGIIFSAPMVRALLDGRKTQTRSLIKPQPSENVTSAGNYSNSRVGVTNEWSWLSGDPRDCDTWGFEGDFKVPYAPGDRLYVRENFWQWTGSASRRTTIYAADGQWIDAGTGWSGYPGGKVLTPMTPCIHMERWRSRLTLTVTDVRVQRVAEISEADARAEGLGSQALDGMDPRGWFRDLWNSLHTKPGETWADSPWVVAVSFDVRHGNIDRSNP